MPEDKKKNWGDIVTDKNAMISLAISFLPYALFVCVQFILPSLIHTASNLGHRFFPVIFISILLQPLAVAFGISSLLGISRDGYCRDKWCAVAGILIAILTMVMMGCIIYKESIRS
jgi:hypothetical protein